MSIFTRLDAPRLRPLEIAASFVSRLAAWLRYTSAGRFCFDFELSFDAISAGRPDQLQQIAELTDTPLEDLSHGPVRHGRQFAIEGEILSTCYLDRVDLWICPECAREDLEAAPHLPPEAAIAMRRDDIVTAIGSCAVHKRALVNFGRQDWKHGRHDTSMSTIDVALRLDELMTASEVVEPSPIDLFVRDRFAGKRQGFELLDPMPLNDVLRICGPFGNWHLTGGQTNLRHLPRNELNRFLSAGLEILAGGEERIAEAVQASTRDAHGLPRHAVMEYVGRVMYDNQDAPTKAIHDIVAKAARHQKQTAGPNLRLTLPAAASEPERRWCTIQYVVDRYRTGPKAARAFVQAAGALKVVDGVEQVDVALIQSWMATDGGIASSTKVAETIGATDYQMDMLVSSGILVPVVPRSGAKKSYDWFRPHHVDAVMDRMLAALQVVDVVPEGMLTLTEMLACTRGALAKVNDALLDGTFPAMRLSGQKPYASIIVRMDDVLALMGQDQSVEADYMTLAEFGEACGFSPNIACTLAVAGVVKSEFRISPTSGMRRRMIPKTEVQRFRRTYISAARLADETGRSRVNITAQMAKIGIEPIDSGKAKITLFEREKIANLMPG